MFGAGARALVGPAGDIRLLEEARIVDAAAAIVRPSEARLFHGCIPRPRRSLLLICSTRQTLRPPTFAFGAAHSIASHTDRRISVEHKRAAAMANVCWDCSWRP